jgi:4-diphosphocytidyl-2-C-methyl-D-erythritol kinase
MKLTLRSPAKVNLFFKVVEKRHDGYHSIASLFQTIDLCDTLHFELADKDQLTSTASNLPLDQSNLILKAADLFRKKTNTQCGLKVHLEKNIPLESGLGGGSSNAATTLWALTKLLKLQIPTQNLQKWGAEIGSDIPFFFSFGTAYCTGRGEHVLNINQIPEQQLWIVKPPVGLSTKSVYDAVKVNALQKRDPHKDLNQYLKGMNVHYNDLENSAFELQPYLKDLKMYLSVKGFKNVTMTGSGSALFCIGSDNPPSFQDHHVFKASYVRRAPEAWY